MKNKNIWKKKIPTFAGILAIVLFTMFSIAVAAAILAINNWEFLVSGGCFSSGQK